MRYNSESKNITPPAEGTFNSLPAPQYRKWRITIQFEHDAHPDHDQARIEEITREYLLQDFLEKDGFEEVEMLVELA